MVGKQSLSIPYVCFRLDQNPEKETEPTNLAFPFQGEKWVTNFGVSLAVLVVPELQSSRLLS